MGASQLLPKTPKDLGKFRIEVPEFSEAKRIKVKAKLTQHGTVSIEGAMIVEEEEYEEMTKEKRELPPSDDEPEEVASDEKAEPAKVNGDAKPEAETAEKEKPKEGEATAPPANPDADVT